MEKSVTGDIAVALKAGQQTIAERHNAVTVMFADIVGFTQLSATLSTVELTELLNRLFSCFDHQGRGVALRVGIASGPVTAGVIGHLKFCYDVWGDTVNTASRMTTLGVANRIQLAKGSAALLAETHQCVPRGVIEVKGKWPMPTWFIDGRMSRSG